MAAQGVLIALTTQAERLVRRLRSDARIFDTPDHHKIHRILRRALRRQARRRLVTDRQEVGPYSGLTRMELRQSRTRETDWY